MSGRKQMSILSFLKRKTRDQSTDSNQSSPVRNVLNKKQKPEVPIPSTSATTQEPCIQPSTSATTQEPCIQPSTSATTQEPCLKPSTSATTQEPCIQPSTSETTQEPCVQPSTSATTQNTPGILPISTNDISKYVNNTAVSSDEKYRLLQEKVWVPTTSFKFPVHVEKGHNRSFQKVWLEKFEWLEYSPLKDGGYCKHCILFGPKEAGTMKLGVLVAEPMVQFKKAKECMKKHESTEYHKFATLKCAGFLNTHQNPNRAIDITLDNTKKQQIEKNRKRLLPIISTIILHGRRNISLRGHRDDGALDLNEKEVSSEEGNFRALLKFRIEAGDKELEEHLKSAARNSTYISKTSQNDYIECCHTVISKKVTDKVRDNVLFSLLVDETTDVSTHEQVSLFVRYLDRKECVIQEAFLCFVTTTSTTGEALTDLILSTLKKYNLDIQYLRGQGFDGGANMSGQYKGVQARIKAIQPLAIFMHCANHKLNLAITNCCKIQNVRNLMGTTGTVINFISESSKRAALFETLVKKNDRSEKRLKLKSLCETRWIERHDAIIQFLDLFEVIVDFLEEVDDSTSSTSSANLLSAVCQFDFLLTLSIVSSVFGITLPLARCLQSPSMDLKQSFDLVQNVVSVLQKYRNHDTADGDEDEYDKIYEKCSTLANNLNIEVVKPRISSKQRNRSNIDTGNNIKEHYRLNVYLPFLDHLLSELRSRFSVEQLTSVTPLFDLMPDRVTALKSMEHIVNVANIYRADLPNPESIRGELALYREFWIAQIEDSVPKDAGEVFAKTPSLFPNVRVLIQILCTLPVTTASVERSFSSLKVIKTYLRSTMSNDRLNGLASLFIHKNVMISPSEVVEEFARRLPRRLELL